MSSLEISVVIATKDRAEDLERTLATLEEQRGAPPFETIVVDNGSSDATPEVIRRVQGRGARVAGVYEARPNRGAARNRGVERANGRLVVFVDDDVWLPPAFLAAHAAAHREPPAHVVTGPIVNIPTPEHRPKVTPAHYSRAFFCTCNASVPKAAFDAVGGFDEGFDLYGWEDTELGTRLRDVGLEHTFAWDAYLYHIKPPVRDPVDRALRRTLEKAHMAARFVRKNPGLRARLATGAYGLNRWRARIVNPRWSLPLWAAAATADVPAPIAAFARARLLDGSYVDTLFRELDHR